MLIEIKYKKTLENDGRINWESVEVVEIHHSNLCFTSGRSDRNTYTALDWKLIKDRTGVETARRIQRGKKNFYTTDFDKIKHQVKSMLREERLKKLLD